MKIQPKGIQRQQLSTALPAVRISAAGDIMAAFFSAVGQDALALPIMQLICILCRTLPRKKKSPRDNSDVIVTSPQLVCPTSYDPSAPRLVLLICNAGEPSLMCKTGASLL